MMGKMIDSSKTHVAVSGKMRDIGFFAGILRAQKIPFHQALTFGRKPVLQIPIAHAAAVQTIIKDQCAQYPIQVVETHELKKAQDIFWVMVVAAIGILSIAWGRYFIRKFF